MSEVRVFQDQPEIKYVEEDAPFLKVYAWGLNRNGELSLGKECRY